ncbi:MAG TPA: hypothetical protein VFB61_07880, partial [Gemmatimonadales bacterium]|nr:hypothetical protein [Gemmatimonadales bacterium]
MKARVTSYSQSDRLRERMGQAEVRHGQEIRADLPGIRVEAMGRSWFSDRPSRNGVVFFCTMGPITVRETTTPGDGGPLPGNAIVEGLNVPAEGIYDLKDVLVQSNGDLRVIIDGASRVEPVARSAEASWASPM